MSCPNSQEILRKATKVNFRICIVAVKIPKGVSYQKNLSRYPLWGKAR